MHNPAALTLLPHLTRADNTLARLPEADQQRLADWLDQHSSRDVQKLAAQPRPDGLDLHVSHSSLLRFRAKLRLGHQLLGNTGATATPDPIHSCLQLIEQRALEELADPDATLADQRLLTQLVLRLAHQRHRDQTHALRAQDTQTRQHRAQLATQRFQFDVAKAVRARFPFLDDFDYRQLGTDTQRLDILAHRLFKISLAPTPAAPSASPTVPPVPPTGPSTDTAAAVPQEETTPAREDTSAPGSEGINPPPESQPMPADTTAAMTTQDFQSETVHHEPQDRLKTLPATNGIQHHPLSPGERAGVRGMEACELYKV